MNKKQEDKFKIINNVQLVYNFLRYARGSQLVIPLYSCDRIVVNEPDEVQIVSL